MSVVFRIISVLGILGAVAAVGLHYLLFGPKHREIASDERDVKRFSIFEIMMHAVTVLSFLTLAITGMVSVIFLGAPLEGWLRVLHIGAALLFAAGLALMAVRWAEDSRFEACDWEWAKKCGGYLGGHDDVDADRFNGGQKAFFWAMCLLGIVVITSGLAMVFPFFDEKIELLLLWAHRLSALFMIMAVLVHIYLGSIANPGTLLAIIIGKVSRRWAEHHHNLWWKRTKS